MSEQQDDRTTARPEFGSRYRLGREQPGYQVERLRTLCSFSTRLVDAYARRLAVAQRQGRELWDGHRWLAEQREALTRRTAELEQARDWHDRERQRLEKESAELRGWLEELEQARDWNATERQRWEARAHELEERVRRLEETIAQQDARIESARAAVATWSRRPLYRLLRRLKLLDDVRLD